jgi:hypothetical protein
MPTARVSLTVSSARMPFLEKSKKQKIEVEQLLPWEKYPGYWDTPHGRLARVRYVIPRYNPTLIMAGPKRSNANSRDRS